MTGPHGDMTLIEHLRTVLGYLPVVDEHTRKVNDRARDVPDHLQIKAQMGRDC